MTLEQIAWRGVHVEKPNDDRTVLVFTPLDKELPVWMGYLNHEGEWVSVDANMLTGVTHWAEMPKGAA